MAIETLANIFAAELKQVNEKIIRAAASHADLIPLVIKHLIDAGGKRIRPIFTLASARLCGYEGQRHINLAAAVEFMHTATLLHDDVVDKSDKRRGRETANHIWGNKSSVLVGDYLLGKAFQMMVADGSLIVLEILSAAAARIAEGEVMQLSTAHNIETTIAQYIEVITAKTAVLFAAACEVGGTLQENQLQQQALRSFGMNFGIAFQIIDDALDYSAAPEEFGKTIGDDFREGKVTLPVIYAYQRGNNDDKEFWRRVVSEGADISENELAAARQKILKSEALVASVDYAKNYAEKAKAALKSFADSPLQETLLTVVDSSLKRKF